MSYARYCRLNVHVMASNMQVLRLARRRIARRLRRKREYRELRHQYYREMLKRHAAAWRLYSEVTSGRVRG